VRVIASTKGENQKKFIFLGTNQKVYDKKDPSCACNNSFPVFDKSTKQNINRWKPQNTHIRGQLQYVIKVFSGGFLETSVHTADAEHGRSVSKSYKLTSYQSLEGS